MNSCGDGFLTLGGRPGAGPCSDRSRSVVDGQDAVVVWMAMRKA